MRETGEIIDSKDIVNINKGKLYDNLKLSLKYENGENDEYGINAKGREYFRNTILEVFEHINKGIYVYLDGEPFVEMTDFKEWLYSQIDLKIGIGEQKEFIDRAYDAIKESGSY